MNKERKNFWQKRKQRCLFIVFACFFLITSPLYTVAQAGPEPADSACDPDYWESLKSRAWLEAQREITQNQNLIFKPDSVLEYTCFDQYLAELAEHAEDMFSETDRWGTVLSSDSMDNALENLVASAFRSYLNSNFEVADGDGGTYDLLGGRLGNPDKGNGPDYDEDDWIDPLEGDSYGCDIMNQVWEAAKCMNFIDVPAEDGFFHFENYRDDDDKRFLPARCENDALKEQWEDYLKIAYLQEQCDPNDPEAKCTPWEEDNARTFFEWLDPDMCDVTPPVPTGLIVLDKQYGEYDEYVCLPPGCHYEMTAQQCM